MPFAVGFVLGAIVSPPDVVAPLSIVRRLGVPRRLVVVLEGEGLANDATALILYRFAVAAVGSGVFSLTEAAGEFILIVVGEIAYGVGVGWLSCACAAGRATPGSRSRYRSSRLMSRFCCPRIWAARAFWRR
jgi:CPA1 family monovalent cation:H+ antiporter